MKAAIVFGAAVWPGGVPSPTLLRRSNAVFELWRSESIDVIVPSGGIGKNPPSEAQVMKDILVSKGIPENSIVLESSAKTTIETAVYAKAILDPLALSDVYAVTDAYHMARCLFSLWRVSLKAKPYTTSGITPKPRTVLTIRQWLRELLAFPYYVIMALLTKIP